MLCRACVVLFGISIFTFGCNDEPPIEILDGCDDVGGNALTISGYCPPTTPEILINNLQVSYRRREIEEYAKLLAPEFIFKFQPIDPDTIGKEFWTHDDDSVCTQAFLESPEVAEIRISLLFSGRDTTWNFPGTPLDTLKIRILTANLEVDQTDDITWVVTDQQDMFFRLGKLENGEDPSHWFLYEWDELTSLASPRSLAGRATTWGRLKCMYKS